MFIFKRSTAGLFSALITIALIGLLSGCGTPQPRHSASETGVMTNAIRCSTYETRICRNWGADLECACVDPRRISIQR